MAKVRKDYTVVETTNKQGEPRWTVMLARSINISKCHTQEHAASMAAALNLDPYYLDRGQTRADRLAREKAHLAASFIR